MFQITKRNGSKESYAVQKVINRCNGMSTQQLLYKVEMQLHDGITTRELDELLAEQCATMIPVDSVYSKLSAHIVITSLYKYTPSTFSQSVERLAFLLTPSFVEYVDTNKDVLNELIDDKKDEQFDYFGLKTLEKSYLLRDELGRIVERPQYLFMRVAIALHYTASTPDIMSQIASTYRLMSSKHYIHATPTMFNAGLRSAQLSSCFLVSMEEDTLDDIYDSLKECSTISKYSGGIGIHIHNVRGAGSVIKGSNGISKGIVPMLQVFNTSVKYVDQGGGKRKGSIAVYLEPWHCDIMAFLQLKTNRGAEQDKARELFYALWIPDLFMERVMDNKTWSLFCPATCRGLDNVYGDEFVALYTEYERQGKAKEVVSAQLLWNKMLETQMETGNPYILFKDAVNRKSNQKMLGTIKSSNLCCEIVQYSDKDETAVCNLASIGLPTFVTVGGKFDYDKLHNIVKEITRNLNRVIDINYYPTVKSRRSNLRHRPIGIGVQGFADTLLLMDIPYHSAEALEINELIFETIYHASLEASNELCLHTIINPNEEEIDVMNRRLESKVTWLNAYSSFEGSPTSRGELQFDLWDKKVTNERYDWTLLKQSIMKYGLRNSLLVAPMPTASTSQILGFNECFEPYTSNIYTRGTKAGEFIIVNKYLMAELEQKGLWNEKMKEDIIRNRGSIQNISGMTEHMKNKYKTVWEIPMKHMADLSIGRGPFICQSQSFNAWMETPTYNKLSSMLFYVWQKGLKTGMYYLRRKSTYQVQQFTIEPVCTTCTA